MHTQPPRSTNRAPQRATDVAVYYSSVPRLRPATRTIAILLMLATLATVLGSLLGQSRAHAEPALSSSDRAMMVLAQQSAPKGPGGSPGGGRPPREAMDACAKQASGSTCGFAGRDGQQITGICGAPEANLPLACMPADMPKRG